MVDGQLGGWAAVHSAQYQGQPTSTALQEVGQPQAAGCICRRERHRSSETAASGQFVGGIQTRRTLTTHTKGSQLPNLEPREDLSPLPPTLMLLIYLPLGQLGTGFLGGMSGGLWPCPEP